MDDATATATHAEDLHSRVFRRLMMQVREKRREASEREHVIDAARYSAPERFAAEQRLILRRSPIPVAPSTRLAAPGDTMTFDALGVPALLVRNADGALGAFLNVCRHRAARLVPETAEPCRMAALTCPYHGWTYGLDGSLRGVPLQEGFDGMDREKLGLVPLPVAERHGLIWLACDPEATFDIDAFLGELGDGFRAFGMAGSEAFCQNRRLVKANWKSMIDAFLETYHIARLHKDTLVRYFADTMMASEPVGNHICAALGRNGIEKMVDLPERKWIHRGHAIFLYYVYPNSIFFFSPEFANHLAMYPQGPEETLAIDTMLVPHQPRSRKERRSWQEKFRELDDTFYEEDFAMCERVQEGVRAMPRGDIVIGKYESCLKVFHDNLDRALAEGD